MTIRSIRLCKCGAPAAYGPHCYACCQEHDADHMTIIDWNEPCEVNDVAST